MEKDFIPQIIRHRPTFEGKFYTLQEESIQEVQRLLSLYGKKAEAIKINPNNFKEVSLEELGLKIIKENIVLLNHIWIGKEIN